MTTQKSAQAWPVNGCVWLQVKGQKRFTHHDFQKTQLSTSPSCDCPPTLEGGLVHAGHAGAVVLTRESVDVHLQRNRTDRRAKIKQPHLLRRGNMEGEQRRPRGPSGRNHMTRDLFDSQPVGKVSSVGQRRGQPHHSDGLGGVGGDKVGPGHNHLQHRTSVLTWKHQDRPKLGFSALSRRPKLCPQRSYRGGGFHL